MKLGSSPSGCVPFVFCLKVWLTKECQRFASFHVGLKLVFDKGPPLFFDTFPWKGLLGREPYPNSPRFSIQGCKWSLLDTPHIYDPLLRFSLCSFPAKCALVVLVLIVLYPFCGSPFTTRGQLLQIGSERKRERDTHTD